MMNVCWLAGGAQHHDQSKNMSQVASVHLCCFSSVDANGTWSVLIMLPLIRADRAHTPMLCALVNPCHWNCGDHHKDSKTGSVYDTDPLARWWMFAWLMYLQLPLHLWHKFAGGRCKTKVAAKHSYNIYKAHPNACARLHGCRTSIRDSMHAVPW